MNADDPSGSSLSTLLEQPPVLPFASEALAPTTSGDATEAPVITTPLPEETEIPAIPTPIPLYQNVSGRYRGTSGTWQVELRVESTGSIRYRS